MAETTWSEEPSDAPKKRGIPTWAWFCGAGCLVALIVAIVGSIAAYKFGERMFDPESQWQELAKVLPYDERPEGWTPQFGMPMGFIGFEMITLAGPDGTAAIVMRMPEQDAEKTREQMFDPKLSDPFGLGVRENAEQGEIEIQGRTLRVMRFEQRGPGRRPSEGPQADGASILVDVTPVGRTRPVILQLVGHRERISDDQVADFLEPFHVGERR